LRDRVRGHAEDKSKRGGGRRFNLPSGRDVEFWAPEEGNNLIDVIPYVSKSGNPPYAAAGEIWYEKTYWVHFNIGVEEQSFICPKTIKKRCPICEKVSELCKSKEPDDLEAAKSLAAKERQLFNVIDLRHDKKIQLLDISYHNFGKQLVKELKEGEEDFANFASLEEGYSLKVRFSKESFGKNTFLQADRIDFKQREPYKSSMVKKALDLDEILNILDYAELEKIFLGVDNEDDDEPPRRGKARTDDDDDDEAPPKRRKSVRDEDDDDEDDEEEEPPKHKRGRTRDDDDDEDDEDDDEAPPPKKRKNKKEIEDDDDEDDD
jgi:hypothetical protein